MNADFRLPMMMYQLYQAQADLLFPLRQFARFGAGFAQAGAIAVHARRR